MKVVEGGYYQMLGGHIWHVLKINRNTIGPRTILFNVYDGSGKFLGDYQNWLSTIEDKAVRRVRPRK
jgi:hypothetical protein